MNRKLTKPELESALHHLPAVGPGPGIRGENGPRGGNTGKAGLQMGLAAENPERLPPCRGQFPQSKSRPTALLYLSPS